MSDYSAEKIQGWAQLDDEPRFEAFLGLVVKHKEVWALSDDEGCLMVAMEDENCLPLWPLEIYAQQAVAEEWEGFSPLKITLDNFYENWAPGMSGDEIAAAVFPNDEGSCTVLDSEELAVTLKLQAKKAPIA
ncbi:DUF2750 domain-containing protein [Echinimonas agarilytica]|uniref:DUF2750 domain-containing protein n=1 Tax=Echinimonas agarilytica TaxID=1215918 RepID=A0AA42B691_9GAMM|nr:DUF2750 domain-containing protein [Echinimonas agarilytica]MCM2678475.1 DUF2750 domain-containing protein [Echinimonas agarilytica]